MIICFPAYRRHFGAYIFINIIFYISVHNHTHAYLGAVEKYYLKKTTKQKSMQLLSNVLTGGNQSHVKNLRYNDFVIPQKNNNNKTENKEINNDLNPTIFCIT